MGVGPGGTCNDCAGVATAGHRVTVADDASAAFRVAAGGRFDVLLVSHPLAEVLQPLLRVPARAPLHLPVRLQTLSRGMQRRVVCESVNLSVHGALLRVPHSLPEGAELRFELFLPEVALPLCPECVVVRRTVQGSEPYPGIGVQFTGFAWGGEDALKARVAAWHTGGFRPVT